MLALALSRDCVSCENERDLAINKNKKNFLAGFRTESTDLLKKKKKEETEKCSCWIRLKSRCGRSGLCEALLFRKKLMHEGKLLRAAKEGKRKGFSFD